MTASFRLPARFGAVGATTEAPYIHRTWHPLLLLTLAAIGAAAALTLCGRPFEGDVSWYMIATARWLHGARLYVDILEINPPLAFYLTAPAIYVADALDLKAGTAFLVWLGVIIAVSQTWSMRLMARTPSLSSPVRHVLASALFLSLIITPIPVLGQREHLMLALAVPYLILTALIPAGLEPGRWERAAIGVLASFGLALKPYFLLAPVFMFAVEVVRTRSLRAALRPENLSIASLLIGYVVFVALQYPQYFLTIIPMGRLVYWAYGNGLVSPFTVPILLVPILATILLWPRWQLFGSDRWPGVFLLAAVIGFSASFLLQNKGWSYHALPAVAFGMVFFAWFAAQMWIHRSQVATAGAVAGVAAVLCAAVGVAAPLAMGTYEATYAHHMMAHMPRFGPKKPALMVFSSFIGAGFPLANLMNASWPSRYPTLWLLPGAMRGLNEAGNRRPGHETELRAIVNFARRTTVDDFLRGRPDIVIVDDGSHEIHYGTLKMDFVKFFSEDPRFVEAWRHYKKIYSIFGVTIWQRQGDQPCPSANHAAAPAASCVIAIQHRPDPAQAATAIRPAPHSAEIFHPR